MTAYYKQRLSAERLERCYTLAPPRMQQYLQCELQHLLAAVRPGESVLELGCGYGRVTLPLALAGAQVTGIDVAEDSLQLARTRAADAGVAARCDYRAMDALALAFDDASFDVVACVQNGVAAFRVDTQALVREAWRVLRPGGRLLLSTYAEGIWPDRLAWFEVQAAHGLIGPVDREASRDGVIVCTDGFRSGCARRDDFSALARNLDAQASIEEIDGSSLWCRMQQPVQSSSTGAAASHRFQGVPS